MQSNTDFTPVFSLADVGASEIMFWTLSACGLVFGCCLLIALLAMRHKERITERKIEAILNGEINTYEDYLLYRINYGEGRENFVFSYEDYWLRKLDRNKNDNRIYKEGKYD